MEIADFWTLDTECLRLTIDAFASGASVVDDVVERAGAIEQGSHQPAFLPIGIFDAPSPFGELGMRTRFACRFRKEQRTTKALGAKAIGMLELEGGSHAQACRATWRAIGVTWHFFMAMGVERNSGDALPVRHRFIDVPEIGGRISL